MDDNQHRQVLVAKVNESPASHVHTLLDFELTTDAGAHYPTTPMPEHDGPLVGPDDIRPVLYPVLGLAGEAGEVANKVKKVIRDDDGYVSIEARDAILDELGDVLWYAARVAVELGSSLTEVAQMNVTKLRIRRAQRGDE